MTNAVDYQAELEKIGIYLRAKNFLVYQGQVESIATKNAKELTQMLEEVSRSGELKEEYDRLKAEMEKAEQDTQANFQKKRGVAAQKKGTQPFLLIIIAYRNFTSLRIYFIVFIYSIITKVFTIISLYQ